MISISDVITVGGCNWMRMAPVRGKFIAVLNTKSRKDIRRKGAKASVKFNNKSIWIIRNRYMWKLLTYLLTPWSRVLLEKLTGSAASQEIPRIFRNQKVHRRTDKWPPPVSTLSSIHSPQSLPNSWRSILILSSHLRLGLHNGLFPSGLELTYTN